MEEWKNGAERDLILVAEYRSQHTEHWIPNTKYHLPLWLPQVMPRLHARTATRRVPTLKFRYKKDNSRDGAVPLLLAWTAASASSPNTEAWPCHPCQCRARQADGLVYSSIHGGSCDHIPEVAQCRCWCGQAARLGLQQHPRRAPWPHSGGGAVPLLVWPIRTAWFAAASAAGAVATFRRWRSAVTGVAKPHGLDCYSIRGVRRGHGGQNWKDGMVDEWCSGRGGIQHRSMRFAQNVLPRATFFNNQYNGSTAFRMLWFVLSVAPIAGTVCRRPPARRHGRLQTVCARPCLIFWASG